MNVGRDAKLLSHFSKACLDFNKSPYGGRRRELAAKERQDLNPAGDFDETFKQVVGSR